MPQLQRKRVLIIVPAYNESAVIAQTLKELFKEVKTVPYKVTVLIVDDGSKDQTAQAVSSFPVILVRHPINRGLGGALGTGLAYAKQVLPDVTITFDADGQHDPADIKRIVKPILEGKKDLVIGSRLLKDGSMKTDRWILNKFANLLTYLLFGVYTTDSQSGLRAFSQQAVKIMNLKTQRMEVSSEFFLLTRQHDLRYGEISIKPIYTPYSLSKGQDQIGNLNSFNIIMKLLLRVIR